VTLQLLKIILYECLIFLILHGHMHNLPLILPPEILLNLFQNLLMSGMHKLSLPPISIPVLFEHIERMPIRLFNGSESFRSLLIFPDHGLPVVMSVLYLLLSLEPEDELVTRMIKRVTFCWCSPISGTGAWCASLSGIATFRTLAVPSATELG